MKLHSYLLLTVAMLVCFGCRAKNPTTSGITNPSIFPNQSMQSLTPGEPAGNFDFAAQPFDFAPLKDFNFDKAENFRRISLDECIHSALQNSQVIQDLGGTILRTPDLMPSAADPALLYTDPNFGEEAALSAFDARLTGQMLYQKNDRAFNSTFVGTFGQLGQDLMTNDIGITKQGVTGAIYRLNSQIVYDRNNTFSNRFNVGGESSAYDTFLQAEIRQPLLQGAGVTFNRIAGPNNLPGVNNGVLIARANTDIGLAEFEVGVRDLVSDVENAYWDLYFAYRDLEAKIEARNGAYKIWQNLTNRESNTAATETLQAKEQYYRFAAEVQDAIHGRLNDGTRTNNGSGSGTFRPNGGVRVAERRLRLIAGLLLNDSQLVVPSEMPINAQVMFDWTQTKDDALIYRTELRRQRWVIKRESLKLLANKNHLLPRVDLISRYRVRGFGDNLFGDDGYDPTLGPASQPGSSSFQTLLNGDLQEWEMGIDVNVPIGFRRQNAAVRNSQLSIQRERAVLKEQERQVVFGLSNSIGELDRTTGLLDVNRKRLDASQEQYKAIQEDFKNDKTTIDLVLQAQRRVIESKTEFFQTQVEFMLAVKSVHFEKGTLLDFHNVALTENGWENQEFAQARRRESLKSRPLNYYSPGIHVGNPSLESGSPIVGFSNEFPTESPLDSPIESELPVPTESARLKPLNKQEAKLAEVDQFLKRMGPDAEENGLLRMMAVEIDEEEKRQQIAKQPFQNLLQKFSVTPYREKPESFDGVFDKDFTSFDSAFGEMAAAKPLPTTLPPLDSTNVDPRLSTIVTFQSGQTLSPELIKEVTDQLEAENEMPRQYESTRFSDYQSISAAPEKAEISNESTLQRLERAEVFRLGDDQDKPTNHRAARISEVEKQSASEKLLQTHHMKVANGAPETVQTADGAIPQMLPPPKDPSLETSPATVKLSSKMNVNESSLQPIAPATNEPSPQSNAGDSESPRQRTSSIEPAKKPELPKRHRAGPSSRRRGNALGNALGNTLGSDSASQAANEFRSASDKRSVQGSRSALASEQARSVLDATKLPSQFVPAPYRTVAPLAKSEKLTKDTTDTMTPVKPKPAAKPASSRRVKR